MYFINRGWEAVQYAFSIFILFCIALIYPYLIAVISLLSRRSIRWKREWLPYSGIYLSVILGIAIAPLWMWRWYTFLFLFPLYLGIPIITYVVDEKIHIRPHSPTAA